MRYRIALCTLLSMMLLSNLAAADGKDGRRHGRRGPPPEAIEACTGLVEADPCSFEGRRDDTISGTCRTLREDDALVCFPEGGPPDRGHGPREDED